MQKKACRSLKNTSLSDNLARLLTKINVLRILKTVLQSIPTGAELWAVEETVNNRRISYVSVTYFYNRCVDFNRRVENVRFPTSGVHKEFNQR